MSDGALGRLLALFVAPAAGGPAAVDRGEGPRRRRGGREAAVMATSPRARVTATIPSLAVLCAPDDLRVAAAAARLAGRGTVVLCCWAPEGARRAVRRPATPGAVRLAGTLARRGTPAVASGRLVVVALPDDPPDAVAAAQRVEAAAGDVPVALALAGPRDDAWDALLGERDAGLLVGRDAELLELATDGLAGIAASTRVHGCAVRSGLRGRALRGAVRTALGNGR